MTTNDYGWVQGNNTVGCVFVDTSRGTCIFLPAAGNRNGSSYYHVGTSGYYWSATLNTSSTYNAYNLYFGISLCRVNYTGRNSGYSLRCAQ